MICPVCKKRVRFMVSIIIQGPVKSGNYNCTQDIIENVKNFSNNKNIDMITLSTWENENTEGMKGILPILKTKPIINNDPLNRQKQLLSTLVGASFLKANSRSSWILKIRTDQVVPVQIVDEIHGLKELPRSNILYYPLIFSYVNRTIPFHIGDYFFGGQIDDIITLCEENLSFGSWYFQYGVELDMMLKLFMKKDKMFPLSDIQLLSHMGIARKYPITHPIWQAWYAYYRQYIIPAEKETYLKTKWKGLPIIDEANRRQIYGNSIRATEVFQNYIDFRSHWVILNKNPKLYNTLPMDQQFGKVLYLKDFRVFLMRLMQLKYLKVTRKIKKIVRVVLNIVVRLLRFPSKILRICSS